MDQTLSQGRRDMQSHDSVSMVSVYSSMEYILPHSVQCNVVLLHPKTSRNFPPHCLHFIDIVYINWGTR